MFDWPFASQTSSSGREVIVPRTCPDNYLVTSSMCKAFSCKPLLTVWNSNISSKTVVF